jgi:hypothetical protein
MIVALFPLRSRRSMMVKPLDRVTSIVELPEPPWKIAAELAPPASLCMKSQTAPTKFMVTASNSLRDLIGMACLPAMIETLNLMGFNN